MMWRDLPWTIWRFCLWYRFLFFPASRLFLSSLVSFLLWTNFICATFVKYHKDTCTWDMYIISICTIVFIIFIFFVFLVIYIVINWFRNSIALQIFFSGHPFFSAYCSCSVLASRKMSLNSNKMQTLVTLLWKSYCISYSKLA